MSLITPPISLAIFASQYHLTVFIAAAHVLCILFECIFGIQALKQPSPSWSCSWQWQRLWVKPHLYSTVFVSHTSDLSFSLHHALLYNRLVPVSGPKEIVLRIPTVSTICLALQKAGQETLLYPSFPSGFHQYRTLDLIIFLTKRLPE